MSKKGRPTTFTEELGEKICDITANTNRSLESICDELDLHRKTVLNWFDINPDFYRNYTRAKKAQAYYLAEEILQLSDKADNDLIAGEFGQVPNHAAVQRAKLQIDTRKWVASKLLPKVFGDKIDVTSNNEGIQTQQEVFLIGGKEFKFDK